MLPGRPCPVSYLVSYTSFSKHEFACISMAAIHINTSMVWVYPKAAEFGGLGKGTAPPKIIFVQNFHLFQDASIGDSHPLNSPIFF